MVDAGFKRKLTAILSADIVGYSRLMGDNEEATIRTLTNYREEMGNLIQQHRGRVVDTTGDNLLAEFASAVDAVNCAVEIQKELAEQNTELKTPSCPMVERWSFASASMLGTLLRKKIEYMVMVSTLLPG
jgi:class 3 adenylate cyclase